MIKIAAISGLIIAGITIIIFGWDPLANDPLPFSSDRGEGQSLREIRTQISPSPAPSLNPSVDSKGLEKSSKLSAVFKFNSRNESRAAGLKLESFALKGYPVKKFAPYLPIKVDLEADGKIVWKGEVTSGDCRDEEEVPYCEVRGYVSNPLWWKSTVKLRAYDINGERVASFDYEIARGPQN